MGQIPHACAAILFIDCNSEQTHIPKFPPQIYWEVIIAINLGSSGGDFFGAKLKDAVAKHVDIVAKIKI